MAGNRSSLAFGHVTFASYSGAGERIFLARASHLLEEVKEVVLSQVQLVASGG